MSRMVQARVDEETSVILEQLKKQFGWSHSEAVRRDLQLLASVTPRHGRRKFSGVGKYSSGILDLSTNKKHMEGFGKYMTVLVDTEPRLTCLEMSLCKDL